MTPKPAKYELHCPLCDKPMVKGQALAGYEVLPGLTFDAHATCVTPERGKK